MSTAAPASEPIDVGNAPLPTPEQLPDDLATLKRMIVELLTTLQAERLDKEQLRHRIALLLQRFYGPRTERINPDQLLLFAEWAAAGNATGTGDATPPADAEQSAPASGTPKPKTPHGRGDRKSTRLNSSHG